MVGGPHKNLSARLPIIMGTIPLLTGPTAFKPTTGVIDPALVPNQALPSSKPDGSPAPAPTSGPALPAGGGWNLPQPAAPSPTDASVAPSAPPLYPQLRKYLLLSFHLHEFIYANTIMNFYVLIQLLQAMKKVFSRATASRMPLIMSTQWVFKTLHLAIQFGPLTLAVLKNEALSISFKFA